MKAIVILLLLFTAPVNANTTDLQFQGTTPPQFTYEVTDHALALTFTEAETNRKTTIKPTHTIAQETKLTLNRKSKAPVEMLFVVQSRGNLFQILQLFVPSSASQVAAASATDPLCQLENFGDYSWEKPTDLKDRIRTVSKNGKTELQIKVGQSKTQNVNKIKHVWTKCFVF